MRESNQLSVSFNNITNTDLLHCQHPDVTYIEKHNDNVIAIRTGQKLVTQYILDYFTCGRMPSKENDEI